MIYRMIALDLDGTLLSDVKEILPETQVSLMRAAANGVHIVPATGRPFSGVPESVLRLTGLRYLITSNGAATYDLFTGTILRRKLLSHKQVRHILDLLSDPGLLIEIFIDGRGYHEAATGRILRERFQGTPLENYLAGSRTAVDDLSSFLSAQNSETENISILFPDTICLEKTHAALRKMSGISVVRSTPLVLEIGAPDADKGKAVSSLASELGISREEILVFGDSNNDFGLFDAAGTAVAMGNATPELKSRADLIAESNEDNGIARTLSRLLPF